MINVNTRQGRAAVLILLLGLGLLVALAPFASGLLAAPVLYVVFGPIYARLARQASSVAWPAASRSRRGSS